MKIIDVTLVLDGLHLKDGETVDDLIKHINNRFQTSFEITIGDLYIEYADDNE